MNSKHHALNPNPDLPAPSSVEPAPGGSGPSTGGWGPSPGGVEVLTRAEAAAFMGVSLGTFGVWEREGRVTIPRYRATRGTGRAVFYARADLTRLREAFRLLEEPHEDPERPGVCRVPIRSGKYRLVALIDMADLPLVEGKHWNVTRRGGADKASTRQGDLEVILATTTRRQTPLKRLILGLDGPESKERVVAHANGEALDCRRANLVVKSRAEVNRGMSKMTERAGRATTSRYKGVAWEATRRMWRAQIRSGGETRMIGRFRDEALAAAAYDDAARAMFGAAALLNFPDGHAPAPTFLGPDGLPVREKEAYRLPPPLPAPPPGEAMLTRAEAAERLEISPRTFGGWERAGDVDAPRYRVKSQTGTPILYAARDIARLRAELDKVGAPYPDPHPARAGVWRVPLRTLGGYVEALIDEADLGIVQGKTWNYVTKAGGGRDRGTVTQVGTRDTPHLQLKRLILRPQGEGSAARIGHANGNPLDCRRANLVPHGPESVTRRCFKILTRSGKPTSSRFKGVHWNEREGAWQAQIRVDDKHRCIGLFDDEEDAASAYDDAAREAWGAQARVNFPAPGEHASAAAPAAPADLAPTPTGGVPRMPGKPADLAAVLHEDGRVTLSWRCADSAASAGVTFAVLRRLPGQREFVRIGTAGGTTGRAGRAAFTDATVPAESLAHGGPGAQYVVRGARANHPGEASDPLVVLRDAGGALRAESLLGRAA